MTPAIDPNALGEELLGLLARGRDDETAARCRELLEAHPGDRALLELAAHALARAGAHADSAAAFERRIALDPGDPGLLCDFAQVCQHAGELRRSEALADGALALHPGFPPAISAKAEAMYLLGRFGEAFEWVAPLARSPGAPLGVLIIFARLCRTQGKEWQGISLLEQALANPGGQPRAAIVEGYFQLGALYDAKRRYDEAWGAITHVNRLKAASFDPDEFDRRVGRMLEQWTPSAVAALPEVAPLAAPVLIVGMPRSGTTLVEQILASHPSIAPGGELTALYRAALRLTENPGADPALVESARSLTREAAEAERARYASTLRSIAAAHPGDTARVTDKMPINALLLNVARAVAPGARIIWTRRDPLDTCISCFFHNFGGANSFSYDLTHLGRFHAGLERAMRHWQAALGLEILELPYEDLVADQPGWSRRLLQFVDLPWHDACLRYHETDRAALTLSSEQVRRPMFSSSVRRWERYEAHLGPLRKALEAAR